MENSLKNKTGRLWGHPATLKTQFRPFAVVEPAQVHYTKQSRENVGRGLRACWLKRYSADGFKVACKVAALQGE